MKKIILLSFCVALFSFVKVSAQNIPVNPIPSYNYLMATQSAAFTEIKSQINPHREKRDVDVVISTTNHGPIPIVAKVWVIKKSSNTVLGPYYIVPNQLLTVGIDYGKWSVLVKCPWEIYVDVWTE